jgi:hypothetical protein
MNNLSKECIELLDKEAISYSELMEEEGGKRGAALYDYMKGMTKALTTPSIYQAAGLTEATPLTDKELEAEAERLYPKPRLAHIKARKMGSSNWVSELVNVQKEYIQLLESELGKTSSMCAVHGYMANQKDINKGIELREKIKNLTT